MIGNRLLRLAPLSQRSPAVVSTTNHHLVSSSIIIISTRQNHSPAERLPLTENQKKLYPQVEQEINDEGFPILRLKPKRRNIFAERSKLLRRRTNNVYNMREQSMKEDQDWPSVWPTAKTFVPSAVPLPMRQSFEQKSGSTPRGKYVNTELLKVVNFLHLTPGAIKRHCQALSKFCTKWPEGLDTDEQVREHFPVTYVTNDYCHSSPTIRDPRARIVELRVNLDDLKLEAGDRKKLIELARHRYDPKSNMLKLHTKDCPMRIQNKEYADYLLSAVYFESQEHQEWEKEWVDDQRVFKINLDEYREEVEKKLGLKRQQ